MLSVAEETKALFKLLGLSERRNSTRYLYLAVELAYEKDEYINDKRNGLREFYTVISVMLGISRETVERAIHHAVLVAWSVGDVALLEELFGPLNRLMPTNREFITALVKLLKAKQ